MMVRVVALAALVLLPLPVLHGQCADGSPPPCGRPRAARPAIDANRVAILPFRVTTTDTLLGEGFAELLATEFTVESGPRAIDMATVLAEWRRAGGGLRTPLARERVLDVARSLGAGLVTEGSIVGIGQRITVTASIVDVQRNAARGRPVRVTASIDSLDSALRQTIAGLIAAMGGAQRTLEGARYTESPQAMRHYLAGLYAWRRGQLVDAVHELERAMVTDTSFAQAAFRRHLANAWQLPASTFTAAQATRRAFEQRHRLSPPERMMIEATVGHEIPDRRTTAVRLAAADRAAQLLPDSPEALFRAGDLWLHAGAAVDPVNQLLRARDLITRAAAIDSAATALRHLVEIGVRLRDTAMLRRTLPGYARSQDIGRWPMLFAGWASIGDEARLAELRRDVVRDTLRGSQAALGAALLLDIRAPLLDEMISTWIGSLEGNAAQEMIRYYAGTAYAVRGRPTMAERTWEGLEGEWLADADRDRVTLELNGLGVGLDVEGAIARIERSQLPDAGARCELVLLRLRAGEPVDSASLHGPWPGSCGRTIAIARIPLDQGERTLAMLETGDSTLRNSLAGLRGYESLYLSRAWERAGKPERALRAIRYRNLASWIGESPWLYPEEERLARLVGDTAGAERARRNHEVIVRDAEPFSDTRPGPAATLRRP